MVRASVLQRLRSLTRVERETILRASVIGYRFEVTLLRSATRTADRDVRRALAHAVDLQLILADDNSDLRFVFRHALTREIVYAELSPHDARAIHRQIADDLERRSLEQNPILAELAHHALLSGDRSRASRFNELAGDRAAGDHAIADACTFYRRAQSVHASTSPAFARLERKVKALIDTS